MISINLTPDQEDEVVKSSLKYFIRSFENGPVIDVDFDMHDAMCQVLSYYMTTEEALEFANRDIPSRFWEFVGEEYRHTS